VRSIESLVPQLDEEYFFPEEAAKISDIRLDRLCFEVRFSGMRIGRMTTFHDSSKLAWVSKVSCDKRDARLLLAQAEMDEELEPRNGASGDLPTGPWKRAWNLTSSVVACRCHLDAE
jgi:hypothetical protein